MRAGQLVKDEIGFMYIVTEGNNGGSKSVHCSKLRDELGPEIDFYMRVEDLEPIPFIKFNTCARDLYCIMHKYNIVMLPSKKTDKLTDGEHLVLMYNTVMCAHVWAKIKVERIIFTQQDERIIYKTPVLGIEVLGVYSSNQGKIVSAQAIKQHIQFNQHLKYEKTTKRQYIGNS